MSRNLKVAGAGALGLVVAGPPAALVAAGIALGATDPEYALPLPKIRFKDDGKPGFRVRVVTE